MIGVIADDTTSANDIGVMFAKHGWATAVVAHDAPDPLPDADARVLDTDSRLDPPEHAYGEVLETSKAVAAALADVTGGLFDRMRLQRPIVAGGDTSGTICRRLGIHGNWVLHEIATGVPSGLALGRSVLLVLKSGSFGDANILRTAIRHLQSLGAPSVLTSA